MMHRLAALVMRGRGLAVLAVSSAAVLSFLVPPVGWLSTAALVLVTLRRGAGEGLLVMLGGVVGSGVLAYLAIGTPVPALSFLGVLWLPAWLIAVLLRATVSLAAALEGAALLGILTVIGVHAFLPDPAGWWHTLLDAAVEPMFGASEPAQIEAVRAAITQLAGYMSGLVVAAGVMNLVIGLLIGRAWQSGLYNPGGFRREFHALRLHPAPGIGGAVLLIAAWLVAGGPGLLADLALVVMVPLALAGLAVAHAAVAARAGRRAWLVALYVLLVLALPQLAAALAVIGVANVWLDIGGRLQRAAPADDDDPNGND